MVFICFRNFSTTTNPPVLQIIDLRLFAQYKSDLTSFCPDFFLYFSPTIGWIGLSIFRVTLRNGALSIKGVRPSEFPLPPCLTKSAVRLPFIPFLSGPFFPLRSHPLSQVPSSCRPSSDVFFPVYPPPNPLPFLARSQDFPGHSPMARSPL